MKPLQMIMVDEDGTVIFVGRVRSYEVRKESGNRIEWVARAQSTSEEPWI